MTAVGSVDPRVALACTPRLQDPAQLLDAVPGERLLVIGSLPPDGRDLDLAVRRCDVDSLDAALITAGFRRLEGQYVRFGERTAQVVDTSVLEDWDLPSAEIEALLEQARPLPGGRRLVRPSPAHVLLLMAPLCARSGSLPAGRRARLEAALQEDPGAWDGASGRAQAWRASEALAVLRQLAGGGKPSLVARVRAVAAPRRAAGTGRTHAVAGAALRIFSQRRVGAVVALSGVDGAGKSSQAVALAAACERLGEDPVIRWSRVRYDPLLARVGSRAKRLLAPLGAGQSATVRLQDPQVASSARGSEDVDHSSPTRVIEVGWAYISAAVDGYRHLRLGAADVLQGRIVICDRYTLDTHVHLVERFWTQPSAARGAAWLDRRLSPRPLLTFWLDVPAPVARRRKPDDVDPDRLLQHTDLYRALHADHGAVRLDARRSPEELAAIIAAALWEARSRSGRATRPRLRRTGSDRAEGG